MAMIPFGDLIRHHAGRRPPQALAVHYPDDALTWAGLEAQATRWARLLQDRGVGQDDLVVVSLPNGTAFHAVNFAVWKLGATPTVVSAKLPEAEFAAIIDLVKPKLIVGRADAAGAAPHAPGDSDLSAWDPAPFPAAVPRYWKAMTSGGSTGRPKVIVDHMRGEWNPDGGSGATYRIDADSVVLNPGPLYHNTPYGFTHLALFNGAQVVGMDRFDPEEALRLIDEHRVTCVSFVPTMMHRIWSLPAQVRARYDVSSLQSVWHMAAPCPAWLKEAWIDWLGPEKIYEIYGGTEGYGRTLIRGDEWLSRRGSVGRIVGESRIKAVREDGADCAPGEVGELYFLHPDMASRPSHYIGAEAKVREGGWCSLGDMGHVDADGYVFLADRRTDLILRGGANVYPAEVEAALEAHPQVASALVVSVPCDDLGQRVHALVQPKPEERLDLADLHAFLETRLARYKLPESYELADTPLRDDAGKARRSAIRDERAEWLRTGKAFQLRVAGGPPQAGAEHDAA